MHWSHPLQRTETELLWNFGVSTCSICKVILKFSSVTLRLQCPCWKPTIYHLFVDILSRYHLFWWLVPEKIAFSLQWSGTKYWYFIWAKQCTARRTVMVHSHHFMSRYRVNARNQAESTELSKFTPPCAGFCWVGSTRAVYTENRINLHFEVWEKFRQLGNERHSPFCRTEWFHIHVKMAFFHCFTWVFGLLVKVVESYSVGLGSIASSSQVRQRSAVGQVMSNSATLWFLTTWNFNPILKFAKLTASSSRLGVLAKAM